MNSTRGKATQRSLDQYNRWLRRTHKQPAAVSTALAGRPLPEEVKKRFRHVPYYMQVQQRKEDETDETGV